MKILLINPLDYRYGTTYRTRMFLDSFKRLGHEVTYVESNYKEEIKGVISIKQTDNLIGYLTATWKRILLVFNNDYGVLFLENFTPLVFPCILAAKLKRKYVLVDWDAFEYTFQKTIFRKVLTYITEFIGPYFADQITSPSDFMINEANKRNINKIRKAPQCIDTSFFDPVKFNCLDVKKEMLWPDKIVLGYLCGFNPGGIRDLSLVASAVKKVAGEINNVVFLVIGEGGAREDVIRILKDTGISNYYICDIKDQNKLLKYLSAIDVGLVYLRDDKASRMRTSIKVLAYLALNKEVVGHTVGESLSSFGSYITACQPNPESFSQAIVQVINKKGRGNSSRQDIVDKNDCKVLDGILKEIIENIGR